MKRRIGWLTLTLSLLSPLAHATDFENCVPGQIDGFKTKFVSLRSGYYPSRSQMEGGFTDRAGRPLKNLQDYLKGKTSYVSVAMDSKRFPYGTHLRIPQIELEFGRCIDFRVVDTGGRFRNKGTKKIDICNDGRENSYKNFTNGTAEVFQLGTK